MATSRRFFDGAQEELGSLPIEATAQPQPTPELVGTTLLWIKDNGTWRITTVYRRESGIYKYTKPSTKVDGEWS
jgi:hypothetical protein